MREEKLKNHVIHFIHDLMHDGLKKKITIKLFLLIVNNKFTINCEQANRISIQSFLLELLVIILNK